MPRNENAPAAQERGRGQGKRQASAADAPSIAYAAPPDHDVPLGLQRSPYDSDGGALIGRDPRELTREEWSELRPARLVGLKAIRAKCLDCAHTGAEVRRCTAIACALWPLRMGSVPRGFRTAADHAEDRDDGVHDEN